MKTTKGYIVDQELQRMIKDDPKTDWCVWIKNPVTNQFAMIQLSHFLSEEQAKNWVQDLIGEICNE
jgi:hypothetical protein